MVKKGNDSEIIAISSIMTLQCPLSLSRINIPCRSTTYTHNQCFDALSFLQLQEQAPTWLCPICSRAIGFDELAIDQYSSYFSPSYYPLLTFKIYRYVADILTNTDQEVERVTIRPDGTWYIEVASTSHGAEQASSGGLKKDSPYQSLATPPSSQSGEQSTSYFASAPVGRGKRPSAVIEISSDEDDEDELPLARKRLRLNTQSTGHSTWPFRWESDLPISPSPKPPPFSLSLFRVKYSEFGFSKKGKFLNIGVGAKMDFHSTLELFRPTYIS